MTTMVDIVFIQNWNSHAEDMARSNISVPEWGEWEDIAEYLTQWDYGAETDDAHTMEDWTLSASDYAEEFEIGGLSYILTWNYRLRYVSLSRAPIGE